MSEYKCKQCNKPMNVVDYMIGEVCHECCNKNVKRLSRD